MSRRLVVLALALCCAACSREAEQVVESWEALGVMLEEHASDCPALAEALREYKQEHGDLFSADMRPIYEEIEADPKLRFRMERAFAVLESQDFACRDDAAVQQAAGELFDELLGATREAQPADGDEAGSSGAGPRKP